MTIPAGSPGTSTGPRAKPPSRPPIVIPPRPKPPVRPRTPGKTPSLPKSPGAGRSAAQAASQAATAAGVARFLGPAAAVALPVAVAGFYINRVGTRTRDLARYSPDIARVQAQNEMLKVQRELAAARRMGPQLAEVERVKGAFGRAATGFLDRQQVKLLENLNGIFGQGGIDGAAKSAVDFLGGEEKLEEIIKQLDSTPGLNMVPFVDSMRQLLEGIQELNKELKASRNAPAPKPIKRLLDELGQFQGQPDPQQRQGGLPGGIVPFAPPVLDLQL